jgi:hypothetical protein
LVANFSFLFNLKNPQVRNFVNAYYPLRKDPQITRIVLITKNSNEAAMTAPNTHNFVDLC